MATKKSRKQTKSQPENDDSGIASSPLDLQPAASASLGDDPAIEELRALVLPSTTLQPRQSTRQRQEMAGGPAPKALDVSAQTLGDSLKSFIKQLTDGLSRAADDLSSLEVRTFAADDLAQVNYDFNTGQFTGPVKVRALTRISFDGDVQVVVPERNGELNQPVWEAHLAMVKEAQANRAQFLGAMAEMATRLIALFSKP